MHLLEPTALDHVRSEFHRIWGYTDFRPPQGEIIQTLLSQQDALVVMPTGGGKSICFQLPALIRTGLTIVVSPLVALMENQVQELKDRGLPACLLHSELPTTSRRQALRDLERQHLRLLYLSPETLLSEAVWTRLCQPHLRINGLILDEAPCLVQWGDTFRPAYRRLGAVRPALLRHKPPGSQLAIAAFTATADPVAQSAIQQVLQLREPQTFLLNPYRPNLNLSVRIAWTPRDRRNQLLKWIQARAKQSGLVYVRTRRDSETLASWLQQQGYATAAYHAGLSPDERRAIESAWLQDQIRFVICTNAFGMGINKPDVRWVVHFHAPTLLSEYVQEVGRAGRDGKPAEALTLVSEPTGWLDNEDRQRLDYFRQQGITQQRSAQALIQKIPPEGTVSDVTRRFREGAIALSLLHARGQLEWVDPFHYRLQPVGKAPQDTQSRGMQQMLQFLRSKTCRWQFLLNAFGFTKESQGLKCGHCDRCSGHQ